MRTLLPIGALLLLAASVAGGEPPPDGVEGAPARTVWTVSIETRMLRMTEPRARCLLGRCMPTATGQVALLSAEGRARLLGSVERGGVELVTSPRITLYDGQRGNASVLNQRSYIKEYEVTGEGDAQIASPVVDTVQDGVVVAMRPFVQEGGRRVLLDLSVTTSTLQRPMAKVALVMAGKPVEIQVPEHTTHTHRRLVRLRPGTHALLRSGAGFWVLVTASPQEVDVLDGETGYDIDLVPPNFEPPAVPGR